MSIQQQNPWDLIKEQLERTLSSESFENWIARTRYGGIEGKSLVVLVPDEHTVAYLREEYSHRIDALARAVNMGLTGVVFTLAGVRESYTPDAPRMEPPPEMDSPVPLNPKFTFESFVVGACNQFAHAAAQAVAAFPSRRYNPLYLYGGVGMGKTHLMHAIGRALIASGHMKIIFTTSERFTNEVVSGIKHGRMPQFRERYRSGRCSSDRRYSVSRVEGRTQEEFFHTFNELHDAQKQIVISSDCPPRDINGLVDRLRSRFEWGLMADIEPPDLETKMAILEKKAELEGATLPPDVRLFIADKTKSNVRELEGALVKLVAYSSLTRAPISIGMAPRSEAPRRKAGAQNHDRCGTEGGGGEIRNQAGPIAREEQSQGGGYAPSGCDVSG